MGALAGERRRRLPPHAQGLAFRCRSHRPLRGHPRRPLTLICCLRLRPFRTSASRPVARICTAGQGRTLNTIHKRDARLDLFGHRVHTGTGTTPTCTRRCRPTRARTGVLSQSKQLPKMDRAQCANYVRAVTQRAWLAASPAIQAMWRTSRPYRTASTAATALGHALPSCALCSEAQRINIAGDNKVLQSSRQDYLQRGHGSRCPTSRNPALRHCHVSPVQGISRAALKLTSTTSSPSAPKLSTSMAKTFCAVSRFVSSSRAPEAT